MGLFSARVWRHWLFGVCWCVCSLYRRRCLTSTSFATVSACYGSAATVPATRATANFDPTAVPSHHSTTSARHSGAPEALSVLRRRTSSRSGCTRAWRCPSAVSESSETQSTWSFCQRSRSRRRRAGCSSSRASDSCRSQSPTLCSASPFYLTPSWSATPRRPASLFRSCFRRTARRQSTRSRWSGLGWRWQCRPVVMRPCAIRSGRERLSAGRWRCGWS